MLEKTRGNDFYSIGIEGLRQDLIDQKSNYFKTLKAQDGQEVLQSHSFGVLGSIRKLGLPSTWNCTWICSGQHHMGNILRVPLVSSHLAEACC